MKKVPSSLSLLNRWSPSNSVVAKIKDSGVGCNKHISKDVEWSNGRGDVDAHEAGEALGLTVRGDLEDVVLRGECEGVAVDHNGDVGQ